MPSFHPQVKNNPTVSSPEFVNVTPSDSVDLKYIARMVSCAVAGDISFQTPDGAIVLAIPANTNIPMQFSRINATNTDATGIIAWF